jgi:predicted S18 family serine protease
MSLYRQAGRARRRRRVAIGAGVLVVAIAVLVVVLASSGGPPSHADRVKSARAAASEALDGIEIVTVEYPQAVHGAPTEFAAAKADVQRAQQSLVKHRADFQAVNAAAYRRATAALSALAVKVARRADITQAVAAARTALQPFTQQR